MMGEPGFCTGTDVYLAGQSRTPCEVRSPDPGAPVRSAQVRSCVLRSEDMPVPGPLSGDGVVVARRDGRPHRERRLPPTHSKESDMNAIEIFAIVALTAYAVYKQTHVSEVRDKGRFKLAVIYGIVGIAVGGFAIPHGAMAIGLLARASR